MAEAASEEGDAVYDLEPVDSDGEVEELFESIRAGHFIQRSMLGATTSPTALIVTDDPADPLAIADIGRVTDIAAPRTALPSVNNFKVNLSIMWKLVKELVGKDLTRFSTPVFLNEPLGIVQKLAEISYFFAHGARKAALETDESLRIA